MANSAPSPLASAAPASAALGLRPAGPGAAAAGAAASQPLGQAQPGGFAGLLAGLGLPAAPAGPPAAQGPAAAPGPGLAGADAGIVVALPGTATQAPGPGPDKPAASGDGKAAAKLGPDGKPAKKAGALPDLDTLPGLAPQPAPIVPPAATAIALPGLAARPADPLQALRAAADGPQNAGPALGATTLDASMVKTALLESGAPAAPVAEELPGLAAAPAPAPKPPTPLPSPLGAAAPPATLADPAHAVGSPGNAAAAKPCAQVARVLVQVSHAADGAQMTLRLDPAELGHVQIEISRAADGSATVHVSAERPETLQLLVADQAQLHQALNSAGVPQDGRTLSLSLTPPDAGGSGAAGSAAGGFGGSSSGQGQPGQHSGRSSYAWGGGPDPAADAAGGTWLRAGVDITA